MSASARSPDMTMFAAIETRPRRDVLFIVTLGLCGTVILLGVLGSLIAPYDPLSVNAAQQLMPPSLAHPCGTDQVGRDICSRIITATRPDLKIGILSAALALIIGGFVGAIAGFYGGWTDRLCMWIVDTIMAFPLFLL